MAGYDILGFETSNGLKVQLDDQKNIVIITNSSGASITLSGKKLNLTGTFSIDKPIDRKYIDGLNDKLNQIDTAINQINTTLKSIDQRLSKVESMAHTH